MADPEAITPEQHHDAGSGPDSPLSDDALLDLLDDLMDRRGRVPAAEVLGVNYRTVARCQQSRQAPRRVRQALQEYRDTLEASQDEPDVVPGAGADDAEESMADRAADLERENRKLRETVAAQAEELEALRRRVAELEGLGYSQSGGAGILGGQELEAEWRRPRRGHGLPEAGVVTLEPQPDESRAFGLAAQLVAQWQEASPSDSGSGSWHLLPHPVGTMERTSPSTALAVPNCWATSIRVQTCHPGITQFLVLID